jgi:hypothetical protein
MQLNGQIEHSGIQCDRCMAFREAPARLPRNVFLPSLRGLRLQPIMLCILPVRVRLRELAVYPRSHVRRRFVATQPAKARK